MKEIKAYVRPVKMPEILHHLEAAGAREITAIRVQAIGALADPRADRRRLVRSLPEPYSDVVKIEMVCRAEKTEERVRILRTHGHTGARGDGRIFVSSVERAINIRTGAEGEDAL
ncbi:MAG TPA: P-II family nitrogen regulator [Thermoanaerobaculia bacterium]|nr:P-II family nitrogen regulator [Thermoanaerobaculia bacterium]